MNFQYAKGRGGGGGRGGPYRISASSPTSSCTFNLFPSATTTSACLFFHRVSSLTRSQECDVLDTLVRRLSRRKMVCVKLRRGRKCLFSAAEGREGRLGRGVNSENERGGTLSSVKPSNMTWLLGYHKQTLRAARFWASL